MQPLETRAVELAGFHKRDGAVEIASRFGHTTCEQQRLIDTCLTLVAGDPVRQGGAILDDPGREMRHHLKAVE